MKIAYFKTPQDANIAARLAKTYIQTARDEENPVKKTELRLWLLSLMAETSIRLGDEANAETYFKSALKLKANDHYVLRTYSDFLLSKKPSNKMLQKQCLSILEMRFDKASSTQDHTHDRDESLYQLEFFGNTRKALELAKNNW